MRPICAAAQQRSAVLEIHRLPLDGLIELRPGRIEDDRGFFSEVWNAPVWREAGINVPFVQDNHSFSRNRGVLRGMHFQAPPAAQEKLVRVSRGSIFDVAVDVRRSSSTCGHWEGIVLSADEWNQLFIPKGFAHGFVTLEDDTEVIYKVSAAYAPALERTVRFDDPEVGIKWPIDLNGVILSDKDRAALLLSQIDTGF
jgi:dTDP-4-dehydrorhamnose 3,5-epimerase